MTVGLIAYLIVSTEYTRRVDIPSSGKAVLVSIGARRSEFANQKFAGEGDWQMLRDWGLNDEQIFELWTPGSVIRARLSLFVSYLGVVLGWTFCFSAFMALELSSQDRLQRASGKTGDREN